METLVIEKGIPIPPSRYYPVRKPEGSCNHCSRMPRKGLKTCDYHLEKVAAARRIRRGNGLCQWGTGLCPNPVAEGRTMCSHHLQSMLDYSNERRQSRIKAELCIECGKLPFFWGQRCVVCRQKYADDPLPPEARKALADYRRHEKISARREQAKLAVEWTAQERTVKILTMRHGLEDGIDRTLEEIGAVFNITRERVRQIESKQLKWLEDEGFDISLLRPPFEETSREPFETRKHLVDDEQRKKANCHHLVKEALEDGSLIKGLCEVCQAVDVVGHHYDYDKPLEVNWLCRKHHMAVHRAMDANNAVS